MLQLPFLLLSRDESRTQARLETPPRQAGRGSPRTEQHTVDRANIYHAWKWQLSRWAMWPVTQRGAQGGKRAGCTPAQGDGELCCCHQVLLATRTPGLLSSVLDFISVGPFLQPVEALALTSPITWLEKRMSSWHPKTSLLI